MLKNAETIRSYLISSSRGCSILSGADCRLLIQWLDDEVPVPTILTTIDAVSAKRRQKRVRSRLSLSICKGTLNKLIGKSNKQPETIEQSGLEKWLEALMFMQVSDELKGAHRTLRTVRELSTLKRSTTIKSVRVDFCMPSISRLCLGMRLR